MGSFLVLAERLWYYSFMKIIKLSQGMETMVSDEDYERIANYQTNYRSQSLRWQTTYGTKDKKKKYYASKTIDYKKWRLHRFIFHLRGIDITGKEIDHISGDTLDNRWENLRLVSSTQNKHNAVIRSDNTSGYKGVSFHKQRQRWAAQIFIDKKHTSLGLHDTALDAAKAYNEAAIEHFGIYANLNKLPKPTA